jgi:epoxide hydrolase-like predicted phosphatase
MIKAVIFDMGGVLLRTEEISPRAELAKKFGMSFDEIDRFVFGSQSALLATLGSIPEEEHWQAIGEKLNLSPEDLQAFQTAFWAGDRPDQVLLQFIDALRPVYQTGLLSNAWSGARASVQEHYHLLDVFDVTVFSAEVGLAKPDAKIYQGILSKMGAQPEEAIFVDDVPVNIEAAQALGIHGVVFKTSEQTQKDILSLLHA